MLIDFEGLASQGSYATLQQGYAGLTWSNAYAIDSDVYPGSGYVAVLNSGEAVGFDAAGGGLWFSDPDEDFDFVSGYFAAAWNNGLQVTIQAYDDNVLVGTASFVLNPTKVLVNLATYSNASNRFTSIDKVVIDGTGGTPWGESGTHVALDDLLLVYGAPPTATHLDATETYTEDTPLSLTGIVVSDADSANVTATLTLDNPAAGTLSTGATWNGVTSTFAAGVWSASGAIADVNWLLANVTFTPALNFNAPFDIFTSVSDGVFPAITGVKAFTGTPVNDAPVLDASKSPVLATVAEDAGAPSGAVGTLVSSLVDFASPTGQVDNVTDVDAGALAGIALTATSANGSWFYSTDNGANWNAVGAVSDSAALLLAADANTRLYFQPSANFNGTVSSAITFRAWDQTSGSAGSKVSAATNGSTSAFSAATDTASIMVTSANDAPTATDDTGITVAEDAPATAIDVLANDSIAPDTGETLSITAVTQPANGTVAITGGGTGLTFQPGANFNGPTSFTYTVSDGNGGSATASVSVNVTSVNDAPVLDATKSPVLATVAEDAGAPSGAVGTLVSSLVDFASPAGQVDNVTDVDAGALAGIALTATSASGSWFYSTDNGTNWNAVGAVSDSAALLLAADASTRLYFQPAANFNGTVSSAITFRAWDQSAGTAGTKVSAATNGGTSAFSGTTDTASIMVSPFNDAPTGGVAITGAAVLGQVLTADTQTLADADGLGTLHYQWLRGGVAIGGSADAPTYTTTLADVGATINLRVSYTDGGNTVESLLSPATATIGVSLSPPQGLRTLKGDSLGQHPDILVGSSQAELLLGRTWGDILNGWGGDDWLDGGTGGDAMAGGAGNDTYVVDNPWDLVNEVLGTGNDTVIASVSYGLGVNLENLYLAGSAHINGTGNTGANLIIGNAGNNTLAGGSGNDTLIGGDGRDVFVFDTAPSASNRDTVHNFIVADDTIQLSRSVFWALTPGVLAADRFVTGAAALDANDRIIYNTATGALLYDADGSGGGAAVQFATLVGVVGALSETDFVVV